MNDYPKWVYLNGDGIIVDDAEQHEEAKKRGFGCHGTVTKAAPKTKAAKKAK